MMKPGDILEYRCPRTKIVWQWRVHSICLGGAKQESLIEVSPISFSAGRGLGEKMETCWVPEPMTRNLDLIEGSPT